MMSLERKVCENASKPDMVGVRAFGKRLCKRPSLSERSQGFSVVELMVVVGIVGVMLAIAVPSFRSVTLGNRISAEVNTFVGDLQYTRSEAMRRGATVSMCPSSNGTSCLSANTWHLGWIVFNDINGSGTVNTGEAILRRQLAWRGNDVLVAIPSTLRLTYNRDGFNNTAAAVTMAVRTVPTDNVTTRCVAINAVGRHTIQKRGEGSCT